MLTPSLASGHGHSPRGTAHAVGGGFTARGQAPIEPAADVELNVTVIKTAVDDFYCHGISFRSDDPVVVHVERRNQAVAVQLP